MPDKDGKIREGRICLFDSHTNSVKQIARFSTWLRSYEVEIAKDKVDYIYLVLLISYISDFCN